MQSDPVELVWERACHFKKKPEGKRGCLRCGQPKGDRCHMGAPPSFNALGSGNPMMYQSLKKAWEGLLGDLLAASGLPTGLDRIVVEGEATYPDRARRDQGNARIVIEKALGDVLSDLGYIEDDDWTRYSFGDLAYRYEKGVSRTRLLIMPTASGIALVS